LEDLMSDDSERRKRNLFIVNGAGLLCVAISVLMVTTGNIGWPSLALLAVAFVLMLFGRRFHP
jgi:hypothetical protein